MVLSDVGNNEISDEIHRTLNTAVYDVLGVLGGLQGNGAASFRGIFGNGVINSENMIFSGLDRNRPQIGRGLLDKTGRSRNGDRNIAHGGGAFSIILDFKRDAAGVAGGGKLGPEQMGPNYN